MPSRVLHLAAGSEPERVARRRDQWGRALAIARRLRARDQLPLLVLGDVNSTGWLDDAGGERSFVLGAAADAGFTVPTADLACTEFWRSPRGRFEPSVLDHTLVAGLTPPKATVHGYCARLACRPHPLDEPTAEYATVSDHCPVTLDLPP